jgi:nucleoside-diphosphate-sugar epimerase
MNPFKLSPEDIKEIDNLVREKGSSFNNTQVLITGGTGFIGKWILSFFIRLKIHSDVQVFVLTRDKKKFFNRYPYFNSSHEIYFVEGDITCFKTPTNVSFDYIIHAAADVVKQNTDIDILNQNIEGSANLLKNIVLSKSKNARILFLSSGAVYGPLINEYSGVDEKSSDLNCDALGPYGKGKLEAEKLCQQFQKDNPSCSLAIARCFAFSGPLLPLDAQFAFGNFIRYALNKENIIIKGDGTPMRSYQYPTDLLRWLIILLLEVKSFDIVNVGGDQFVSIMDLASEIKNLTSESIDVIIEKRSKPTQVNTYLPNLNKAKIKYNLINKVSLKDSIIRTFEWNKAKLSE